MLIHVKSTNNNNLIPMLNEKKVIKMIDEKRVRVLRLKPFTIQFINEIKWYEFLFRNLNFLNRFFYKKFSKKNQSIIINTKYHF